MSSIVARAEAHATDVLRARTTRGLLNAAFSFKVFLAHVPDSGPIGTPDVQQIADAAERVIQHIDARIDQQSGSYESKLEFASLIYRIRARLEEIVRWNRHIRA
jgi:hypothetical protein